jgi:hypothetical protein
MSTSPHDEYQRLLQERRRGLAEAEAGFGRWGNLRVFAVLLGVGIAYAAFAERALSGWWLLLPFALLGVASVLLTRAERQQDLAGRAVQHYERALARLDGKWADAGGDGVRFLAEPHLYALDLDVFGPSSLFQLLNAARTPVGEKTLADWLLHPAPLEVLRGRHGAVEELRPRLDLREDLAVLSGDARRAGDPRLLLEWGRGEVVFPPSPLQSMAWLLSLVGLAGLLALLIYVGGQIELLVLPAATSSALRAFALLVFVGFSVLLWQYKERIDGLLNAVDAVAHNLDLIAAVLQRLERERFQSPLLAGLRAKLEADGEPPSRRIAQLRKLVSLNDSRHHALMVVLRPYTLYDLHLAFAVENWRRHSGAALGRWWEALGEIEALSSLAGYAFENPQDVLPEFAGESPVFEAAALAHPLIPAGRAVANDVALGASRSLLVISGSNMSGKSTMLRSIGLNTVLALAGAPVRARSLRLSPLAIGASIRTQDSLADNTSRFYAEILRLRDILQAAQGPLPVLFLLDEILNGTNSHDRFVGAQAIAAGLLGRGAIGLLSTHDLALAQIADGLAPRGANVHFADHLEQGRMVFDYKMRSGVVEKSNALELMRSIGLEV